MFNVQIVVELPNVQTLVVVFVVESPICGRINDYINSGDIAESPNCGAMISVHICL